MNLNIGYFADGPWGHETFKKLIKDPEIKISFICVRYDSKDETLKGYAKLNNIDYIKHKNVNSDKFISTIKKYKCDLFVSMSFNQIFKSKIINLTKYKTINCHAGKLPFYRGRNVLNWVLINDEKEFGITVHFVDEGIDTGDIILQKNFQIVDQDNYKTLLEKAYIECANILYDAILLFKKGEVLPTLEHENKIEDGVNTISFYSDITSEKITFKWESYKYNNIFKYIVKINQESRIIFDLVTDNLIIRLKPEITKQ